jgi:preprotein translocase subunit YajC
MKKGDKVIFMLGLGTAKGEIIKVNSDTVVIKIPTGKTVKRHLLKHNVRLN